MHTRVIERQFMNVIRFDPAFMSELNNGYWIVSGAYESSVKIFKIYVVIFLVINLTKLQTLRYKSISCFETCQFI